MDNKDCSTCFHWLGGIYACCRINLEAECKEGEFEAWEAARPRACGFAEGQTADGRIKDSSAAPEARHNPEEKDGGNAS